MPAQARLGCPGAGFRTEPRRRCCLRFAAAVVRTEHQSAYASGAADSLTRLGSLDLMVAAVRNLLFGILALQMDFVKRGGRVTAMNAWMLQSGWWPPWRRSEKPSHRPPRPHRAKLGDWSHNGDRWFPFAGNPVLPARSRSSASAAIHPDMRTIDIPGPGCAAPPAR